MGSNPTEVRQGLFGGRGQVTVQSLLRASPGETAPFTAVLACELSPGGSVGAHRQQTDVELLIGVAGRGRVSVDGIVSPLEPRSVVFLPLGAVLSLENTSAADPLEYWIVKATRSAQG
jgi:quercetin dioxygenase-like cupin family protein